MLAKKIDFGIGISLTYGLLPITSVFNAGVFCCWVGDRIPTIRPVRCDRTGSQPTIFLRGKGRSGVRSLLCWRSAIAMHSSPRHQYHKLSQRRSRKRSPLSIFIHRQAPIYNFVTTTSHTWETTKTHPELLSLYLQERLKALQTQEQSKLTQLLAEIPGSKKTKINKSCSRINT